MLKARPLTAASVESCHTEKCTILDEFAPNTDHLLLTARTLDYGEVAIMKHHLYILARSPFTSITIGCSEYELLSSWD